MNAFQGLPEVLSATIRLDIEPRGDGGLRVFSPDEPGLLMGGVDPEATLARVPAVLQELLESNRRIKITHLTMQGDHVDIDYVKAD